MKDNTEQQIQVATTHLIDLLKKHNSDPVEVEQILSHIRGEVLPAPNADESLANQRVEDALAAQRAVALLRTEARLHQNAADRCDGVIKRLYDTRQRIANRDEDTSVAAADAFHTSVIQPIEVESKQKSQLAMQVADSATHKEKDFVNLRRMANTTVAKIMKDTESAFNKAFQAALQAKNGVDGANIVYEICADVMNGDNEQQHQCQPIPDEFESTSPLYLQWLRNEARTLLGIEAQGGDGNGSASEFKDLVNHIANEYQGEAVLAPVKGYKRTVQKVQEKYNGDYSRVLDLARGMVVFTTIEQLANALQYIKDRHDEQQDTSNGGNGKPLLLRAKDRLSPYFDASKVAGGYRDVLLNLCFDGHIVELQLHIATFLDLKNRRGHYVYEKARSIHMFNEAFIKRQYHWSNESSPDEVEELLDEIRSGAITSINLDYSEALYHPENQTRLAHAMHSGGCRLIDISLRSCFCGDDFIVKCLPLDDEELWSPENEHGHIGRSIRLGSKLHEGTAGRISEVGITRMVRYLNSSLRILDLQGCLDLEYSENSGDSVANAFLALTQEMELDNAILLPQLQELNLKSTGLTTRGMTILQEVKRRGHLGNVRILTDEELRTGEPHRIQKVYLGSFGTSTNRLDTRSEVHKSQTADNKAPAAFIMSRYHPSTKMTDRELTPKGVLTLSSGDCRDLLSGEGDAPKLLNKISAAPYCKVTRGFTISRRLERIVEVFDKYPHLREQNKLFAATPYEEAYSTATSVKVHDDVENALMLVAFGGSTLHVLSVKDESNNLLPGSNAVTERLSSDILNGLKTDENELVGTEEVWLHGHVPPLPPKGTFYITFPLDEDLNKSQYMLIARLFKELNRLVVEANGSYLVCGAPTNINPNGAWWPDKSPRVIRTTFVEIAIHSALPQIKNYNGSGITCGGLMSNRYKVTVGDDSSSVHEMVLSAMAAPQHVIDESPASNLRGIGLAQKYFE